MFERSTIGVIGLGSIGLRHATNLLEMGYPVIGFDPDEERQNALKEKGGKIFSKKEEVFDKAGLIVIASPSAHHRDDLRVAVSMKKHVFVEKPLSHSLKGLEDVPHIAKEKNLIVAIGMNMRFNPAVMALASIVKSGELGSLLWANYWHSSYLPDWRPGKDHTKGYAANPKTGGVIFDVIHGFDLVHVFLGPYQTCCAYASHSGTLGISAEDSADIICRHKIGITSTLHMDFITRPKTHRLTLAGTKGVACLDITNRLLECVAHDHKIIYTKSYQAISVNDDYKAELKDFIEATNGAELHGCSIQEGIDILKNVIDARNMAGLPHAE